MLERILPQSRYKIGEARKNFAAVLERANQGEEIIIMRGNEVIAAAPGIFNPLREAIASVLPG